jgi:hypothetical protein
VEGAPPYKLPDELTDEFVVALMSTKYKDENWVAELAIHLPKSEKTRLYRTCHSKLSKDTWIVYSHNAKNWASILNEDNKWHLEDFKIVYRAKIDSWWVHEIVISSYNNRFAVTSLGVLTFPEFEIRYGMDIVKHLLTFKSVKIDEIDNIIQHITSDLVTKNLTVVDPDGNVCTKEFIGVVSQPPSEWVLPKGHVFLST